MPRFEKPDEFESTVALTTDELDVVDMPVDDNAVTGTRHARDVIIPFDYNPEDPITQQLHTAGEAESDGEAPRSEPVPFSLSDRSLSTLARPAAPAPPASESDPEEPTSIFTSRPPPPVEAVESNEPVAAETENAPEAPSDLDEPAYEPAPSWVIGYLLLCMALTFIGLVVLFFERRMLGAASPF